MNDFSKEGAEKIGATIGEADWRVEEQIILEQNAPLTRETLLFLHTRLCEDAKRLMINKNHDYASETDPFRNFRSFGSLGILVRLSDKLARLRGFTETGTLKVTNESLRDTILDIINYAILFHGYLLDGERPHRDTL